MFKSVILLLVLFSLLSVVYSDEVLDGIQKMLQIPTGGQQGGAGGPPDLLGILKGR